MQDAPVADLKTLLAEHASPPTASVVVPLNQAIRAEVERLEAELAAIPDDAKPRRAALPHPAVAKAREIEAAREKMRKSEVTFTFKALTHAQREQIRIDMQGRDQPDETNLRVLAAMCVSPSCTWEDFRDLRDSVGVVIFEAIDATATRAAGVDWSVPFSATASLILSTET